jgi:hypothetical protein
MSAIPLAVIECFVSLPCEAGTMEDFHLIGHNEVTRPEISPADKFEFFAEEDIKPK